MTADINWTEERLAGYRAAPVTGWSVHYPGCRASFRTLADAYLESLRRGVPVLRAGKPVTVTSVSGGNGGLLLTARWAK